MPNSRLRFVALPLVAVMILLPRVVPASWQGALMIGLAVTISLMGIVAGVEAWRGAKLPHA